jgi:PAS domain S-box-containing protein
MANNLHDVTKRKKAEDTLQQTISELSVYKYALDASAIVSLTDQKGIIRHVNENFCKISGYSETELVGQDHRLINSGFHDKKFIKHLWHAIASGKIWEGDICNRRKDGSIYWVAATIVPFLDEQGKPYQYAAIKFDRTEAKQARQELIEKNKQIGNLLESINDAFFSLNRDWTVQYWNNVAEQILKTPKETILGKHLWSVFKTSVNSLSYKYYHEAMESGEVRHFEDYYEVLDKWYDISAYPSETGLSVFFKDITQRKIAEQELKAQAEALELSNQRYTNLFKLSPLPKFVFDNETLAFLDVNQAAVNHYGYSREEFLTMTLRDIRPESDIDLLESVIKNAGRSDYFYQPGTFTHRKKNGELIRVEITSSALDYDGRPARIALAMDVTERLKHLEAIEMQNQKLKEISWMQSHIIRAPLARIMGLVGLINTTAPNKAETAEILKYLEISANELDEVIRAIVASANDSDKSKNNKSNE